LVVFVLPEAEPARGCAGDKGLRLAQAAVPGSSEPSGQSQLLSLTWLRLSLMAVLVMQENSFVFW
jgi:hypothetical protein